MPAVRLSADSALGQSRAMRWLGDDELKRTLMRHVGLRFAPTIGLLATTITTAGCEYLQSPHLLPAGGAAIALSAVATATQSKHGVASRIQTSARAKTLAGLISCPFLPLSQNKQYADDRTDDWAPSAPIMSLPTNLVQKTTFPDDRQQQRKRSNPAWHFVLNAVALWANGWPNRRSSNVR
jgi:hypothetical protein